MAEKLEDLNLPQSSVQKIIKEALPENVNIGKDVKAALSRAASMFILYMTAQGTQIAQKSNRKTLTAQDIYEALEETDFEDFIEPLKESLETIKESKSKKKETGNTKNGEDAGEEADEEEEEAADEDNE